MMDEDGNMTDPDLNLKVKPKTDKSNSVYVYTHSQY